MHELVTLYAILVAIDWSGINQMGGLSLVHWIIILGVILLLFGAGRLPTVMGDFAKGIKAFKAGMRDDDKDDDTPAGQLPKGSAPPTAPGSTVGSDRRVG